MNPKKFQNKTNGVTPRRWIRCCNPGLADLYRKYLGSEDWLRDMSKIRVLADKALDPDFQKQWHHIKIQNKQKLVNWVHANCGIKINVNSIFDVMVKRLHEYKRQLMNALWLAHRYLQIKEAKPDERKKFVPRTSFIGGKAAPGYMIAKKIIKFIGCLSDTINNDTDVNDYLKVVFLPNYNVSNAEIIIPAAEVSQHISTAGTEASGTSNMKFVFNGSSIIGTLDGANVEIAQEVGEENLFIFGAKIEEIDGLLEKVKNFFYFCDDLFDSFINFYFVVIKDEK